MECHDCMDEITQCYQCNKAFKAGKVVYCCYMEREDGSGYNDHFCSKICLANCFAVLSEVER